MIKIKKAFMLCIAAMLLMFNCVGFAVIAFAEEETPPEQITEVIPEPEVPSEDNTAVSIDGVAAQFINYLKDKYGAEYEFYYNQIIEQWGSVEGYLLAFGNKLPEEYQSTWDKCVGWLNDYAPVWAVPLAVIIVIIVALVGRKVLNNAIERIVNAKLKPVEQELNLQSKATVSMMHSQKALLGNVPKFADNVKELEEAEKELTDG